jgi:CheY-like chemotaxis protein
VDLLVTDYEMPGMTGLELARACARRDPNVGVLYISGSEPGDELRGDLGTPRRAFLLKPFRGDELLRKVKELFVPGFDPDPVPTPPGLHFASQLSR